MEAIAISVKFRHDWIKPVTENVVWICHLPRTGGTLLLRLLDSHPEFHCHPAVFSFTNSNRIWPTDDGFQKTGENVLEDVFSNMSLERFHLRGVRKQSSNMEQELYPIYFDGRWYREIFKLALKCEEPRNYFNAFFTALFNAWRNNQNLYGNKKYVTGQMTLRKPELFRKNYDNFKKTYSDGKMIFMARKPEDWLASAFHLHVNTPFSENPVEIVEYYKIILRQAVKMENDDSFIVLNFEDLVLKPKQTTIKVAKTLGVLWEESLLRPTLNGAPFYQNSSFELERTASIDTNVLGKGKELPSSVLSAIDKECVGLYRKLVEHRTF